MHQYASTCPAVLDLASMSRWALALPHILRPWTLPPCRGGLRCYHVSHGRKPCLLAKVSSSAATCSSPPDLTSLLRWTPALPHVSWLRALPP
jgi:hypothetical protein